MTSLTLRITNEQIKEWEHGAGEYCPFSAAAIVALNKAKIPFTKMHLANYSCLIPFFNEEKRCTLVVEESERRAMLDALKAVDYNLPLTHLRQEFHFTLKEN